MKADNLHIQGMIFHVNLEHDSHINLLSQIGPKKVICCKI